MRVKEATYREDFERGLRNSTRLPTFYLVEVKAFHLPRTSQRSRTQKEARGMTLVAGVQQIYHRAGFGRLERMNKIAYVYAEMDWEEATWRYI